MALWRRLPVEVTLSFCATCGVALSKQRAESAALQKRMNEYARQNLRNGAAIAVVRERATVEQESNAVTFYEGRITRGEYNKKRREIDHQLQEQLLASG